MHQEAFWKGSTIVSCEILNVVDPTSTMIEMKKFVSKWKSLQTRFLTLHDGIRILSIQKELFNKSGNTGGALRNRCDSNEALCTLNRLHQESGERQFRPMPFRKYQHWHQSSSSSFQLVAMEWFLVEFIVIENDDKWGCMQNDMGERWNQFCLVFGWNLWQTTFNN